MVSFGQSLFPALGKKLVFCEIKIISFDQILFILLNKYSPLFETNINLKNTGNYHAPAINTDLLGSD